MRIKCRVSKKFVTESSIDKLWKNIYCGCNTRIQEKR